MREISLVCLGVPRDTSGVSHPLKAQGQTAGIGTEAEADNVIARCSITGSLITTPEYRTCTTCPAISLLPSRIRSPQIAVDEEGLDKDHERFKRPIPKGQEIVQQVLESCQSCILCGGRWIRAI